jgi:parvulin-like peptidyl-prolyl isomerase
MKRAVGAVLLLAFACALGVASAETLCRAAWFRGCLGRLVGRGDAVAIVNGVGFYEADVAARGDDATALVVAEQLRRVAANGFVSDEEIEREIGLFAAQFGDAAAYDNALVRADISGRELRDRVIAQLQERQWLERQITPGLTASDEECRRYYEEHPEEFTQPQRFRARHLFLAANAATPPDVVAAADAEIRELRARLTQREDFAQLAAEASEDKATKNIGGDLGWFARRGVPAEFADAVSRLRIGDTSAPFRSRLGFHVAQLTGVQPIRRMTFEEARAEIAGRLANEKRAGFVAALEEQLGAAEFIRRRD